VVVFQEGQRLRIHSGRQHMKLKPSDFEHYVGARAQRGRALPRGYRQPSAIEAGNQD
jgi:topoisomerase-4 subunit A